MARYRCSACGYIYDEETKGTPWEDLPNDRPCPECFAEKSFFEPMDQAAAKTKGVEGVSVSTRHWANHGFLIKSAHQSGRDSLNWCALFARWESSNHAEYRGVDRER